MRPRISADAPVRPSNKILVNKPRPSSSAAEFSMDEALDYCFRFVRQTANTWLQLASSPVHRARFHKQIFPEKLTFEGKKFGTTKMSLVYKMNQENGDKKSQIVTPPGIEPGFAP